MFSKNILVVLMLLSSLELMSAFNTAKKVGRGMRTALLTTGTVLYGQKEHYNEESVAFHEAAHAVVAEKQEAGAVGFVQVSKVSGLFSGSMMGDCKEPKQKLLISLAGYVQDLTDRDRFNRRNIMEAELGLPISGIAKTDIKQLEQMFETDFYYGDASLAFEIAHNLAISKLGNRVTEKEIHALSNQILLEGFAKVKKMVDRHQKSIHAVGNTLCEKPALRDGFFDELNRFLTGDEVQKIIADAEKESFYSGNSCNKS